MQVKKRPPNVPKTHWRRTEYAKRSEAAPQPSADAIHPNIALKRKITARPPTRLPPLAFPGRCVLVGFRMAAKRAGCADSGKIQNPAKTSGRTLCVRDREAVSRVRCSARFFDGAHAFFERLSRRLCVCHLCLASRPTGTCAVFTCAGPRSCTAALILASAFSCNCVAVLQSVCTQQEPRQQRAVLGNARRTRVSHLNPPLILMSAAAVEDRFHFVFVQLRHRPMGVPVKLHFHDIELAPPTFVDSDCKRQVAEASSSTALVPRRAPTSSLTGVSSLIGNAGGARS